jgi:hypothetical protein
MTMFFSIKMTALTASVYYTREKEGKWNSTTNKSKLSFIRILFRSDSHHSIIIKTIIGKKNFFGLMSPLFDVSYKAWPREHE